MIKKLLDLKIHDTVNKRKIIKKSQNSKKWNNGRG